MIARAVQNQIGQLSPAANIQKFPGTETPIPEAREALTIAERVWIAPGSLTIDLNASQTQKLVGAEPECDPEDLPRELPFSERQRGVEMKTLLATVLLMSIRCSSRMSHSPIDGIGS